MNSQCTEEIQLSSYLLASYSGHLLAISIRSEISIDKAHQAFPRRLATLLRHSSSFFPPAPGLPVFSHLHTAHPGGRREVRKYKALVHYCTRARLWLEFLSNQKQRLRIQPLLERTSPSTGPIIQPAFHPPSTSVPLLFCPSRLLLRIPRLSPPQLVGA